MILLIVVLETSISLVVLVCTGRSSTDSVAVAVLISTGGSTGSTGSTGNTGSIGSTGQITLVA